MGIPTPNPTYLQALDGSTWLLSVNNSGQATTTPLTPPAGVSALPWVELNDIVSGATRRLVVMPCPSVPTGTQGQLHSDLVTPLVSGLPTQLLVSAPNAVVYYIQYASGALQSGLALPASASCSTPISTLALNVLQRLEEDLPPDGPVFWNLQFEVYTALAEAMNELMLLVGRPTMTVQSPLNLNPNSVWQQLPKGLLAITDIYGPQSLLRKVSLFSLDYEQASWGSDWQNDNSSYGPVRWCGLGSTMFVVHPATSTPQQVTINAVQYPIAENWPYNGTETVPFEHHFYEALEIYACVYLRTKEAGAELQNALPMLVEFYQIAKRMSEIQDRRDPLVFSKDFGVPLGVNQIQRR